MVKPGGPSELFGTPTPMPPGFSRLELTPPNRTVLPHPAWDALEVQKGQEGSGELDDALDEATEQLRCMSPNEVVGQEDLAWSFPGGVYVEPEVLSDDPLIVCLEASKGIWPRRASATRTLRLGSK